MKLLVILLALVLTATSFAAVSVNVYPNGTATVTVPASQYINVFSAGSARVYKQVGYPNLPSTWVLETSGELTRQEATFGPYTYETQVKIEAGVDGAIYSVGAGAVALGCEKFLPAVPVRAQLAPATATVTATLTSAQLLSGIIVADSSDGGATPYTLPTGTLLDTASGLSIGQGFQWTLINVSTAAADIITIGAGSGHTVVGIMAVPSAHSSTGLVYGSSATFFSRKTAANTFVTYRMN
ncbi:MAG: hypothetical protein WC986_13615 [Elusimicrobiota bacterium]|jgi:hypothetical protein